MECHIYLCYDEYIKWIVYISKEQLLLRDSNQERRICLMENKKYELDKLMIAMLQILLENEDIDEKTFNISIQKIQNQESRN